MASEPIPTLIGVPSEPIPSVAQRKSGWLWKKGTASSVTGRRNWKRRWFVLDRHVFRYFKSRESSKPLWEGDLAAAQSDLNGTLHTELRQDIKGRDVLQAWHAHRIDARASIIGARRSVGTWLLSGTMGLADYGSSGLWV